MFIQVTDAAIRAGIHGGGVSLNMSVEPKKWRKLTIGIDIRALVYCVSGGIVQNQVVVFQSLFRRYEGHTFFIYCTPFNRVIFSEWIEREKFNNDIHLVTLPVDNYHDWLSHLIGKDQIDVLFRSYPGAEPVNFDMARQIVYIPDIQHENFPDFFTPPALAYRRKSFSRVLREAGAIGSISKFSIETLKKQPVCRCSDFFLMAPALQEEHALSTVDDLTLEEIKMVPDTDYFYFPANIWKHKNHQRTLQAFQDVCVKASKPVRFVMTGSPAEWSDLANEFPDLPIDHLGYVRAELVSYLLQRSRALVFFSLFEGFGIPLLEAFHARTPVVCSNSTSLPEVAGDAALFADPENVADMAAAMLRVLEDDALCDELVAKGEKRLQAFNAETGAENLMAAFQRVVAREENDERPMKNVVKTKGQPLVSIVTPSFNQGRFIRDTIESVLRQTYPNIEYIVMDGGSTDETVEILKEYGDRFDWESEPDNGQTHAINKGLTKARGEVLAYLNSDDVLELDAVEKVVRFLQKNPEIDMVFGKAHYIDENNQITGEYKTSDNLGDLSSGCIICQPAAFWTRRVSRRIGLFDETLQLTMDYDYWLRMFASKTPIAYFDQFLASSRLYQETKTLSQRKNIFKEIFQICIHNLQFVHINFFLGYWHWRLVEPRPHLKFFFTVLPLLWKMPARIHQVIFLHRHGVFRQAIRDRLTFMAGRGSLKAILILRTYQFLKKLIPRGQKSSSSQPKVHRDQKVIKGVYADNWLAEKVSISGTWPGDGPRLRLVGKAPVACNVSVKVNEAVIHRATCPAGEIQHLEIKSPARAIIELEFDGFKTDSANRKLSFEMLETNIFNENDLFIQN